MKRLKIILFFLFGLISLFALAWVGVTIYRKEIIREINAQLGTVINGTVSMDDADLAIWATFPNVSLQLENAELRSNEDTANPILKSEKIFLIVKLLPLLSGAVHLHSLRIQNATVFIYRSATGTVNLSHLKKNGSSDGSGMEDLLRLTDGEIDLKNVQAVYHDSLRKKFFNVRFENVQSKLSQEDSLLQQRLTGSLFFNGLIFNDTRGPFLKNTPAQIDFHFRYLPQSRQLFLDTSTLALPKSHLKLVASVNSPDSGRVLLHIESDQLDYLEGLSVLPPPTAAALNAFTIERPFAYAIDIDAPLVAASNPLLTMQFSLDQNEVRSRKIQLRNISLEGTFTNQADSALPLNDRNTQINLQNVSGFIDKLPFRGDARLDDLQELRLQLHSIHAFDLTLLNELADLSKVNMEGGTFVSEFWYEGKLSEYLDTTSTQYKGKLKGSMTLSDGSLTWIPRKLSFQKLNSSVRFNQDTVWVDRLSVHSEKNQIEASGIIGNYVPFFLQPTKKGFVRMNLQSPSLDLSTLLVKRQKKKSTIRQKRAERKKVSDMIDGLFSNLEFQLALNIEKIKNGNFVASKLKGELKLGQNQLEANKIRMNFGGGTLDASFLMKNIDQDINPIYLTAYTNNVSLPFLFSAFDNFHQQQITHQHLEGTVNTSARLGGKINDNFEFVKASLWGPVRVTVKNGAVNDLPAFQKLSTFLLKRRDFDHVRFAQLDSKLYIKGREIEIERMEIQSNVLGLFLEGVYSMRDKTDLSIQIPLSNLKKRDKKFVPQKVGVHAKAGPSVFLSARPNEKGETVLSYDLFHKFKKKK